MCKTNMSRVGCGFYTHPRSSISKTPLMLANHTGGVIDYGYRGNLIGAFRWLPSGGEDISYTVVQYTRLLQICHPSLCPMYIQVIDTTELANKLLLINIYEFLFINNNYI